MGLSAPAKPPASPMHPATVEGTQRWGVVALLPSGPWDAQPQRHGMVWHGTAKRQGRR